MYGHWIPWLHLLDANWTRANLDRIFPIEDDKYLYWEAAWDNYTAFAPPYDVIFELLRDQYALAVTRLAQASRQPYRSHPMLSHDHFASHLMIFYLRGRLSVDDDLLASFFREASPELRQSAIRFVGRCLYNIEGVSLVVPTVPPPSADLIIELQSCGTGGPARQAKGPTDRGPCRSSKNLDGGFHRQTSTPTGHFLSLCGLSV